MFSSLSSFFKKPTNLAFLGLLLILTVYYVWGVQFIPFHPDEVHRLYQSRDFEKLFTDPSSLIWQKGTPANQPRAIVAPLPKYVVGLGSYLDGHPSEAILADWDWGLSMEANRANGALPSDDLLYAARIASTFASLIAIVWIYLAGQKLGGPLTGWLAALLLGTNPLVLLHGRRSMTEGTLLLVICLALYGLSWAHRYSWLAGIIFALTANTKHSAVVLVPAGLLAVIWPPQNKNLKFKQTLWKLGLFLLFFGVVTYMLNPMIWRYPLAAGREMIQERSKWMDTQIETLQAFDAENQMITMPLNKALVTVANLFIQPMSFYEIGNYTEDTAASEEVYTGIPGHNFLRGIIPGGLLFFFGLCGFSLGILKIIRRNLQQQHYLSLLILATLILTGAVIWTAFLPAQRYVIPLVPISSLWIAYFIGDAVEKIKKGAQKPPKVIST